MITTFKNALIYYQNQLVVGNVSIDSNHIIAIGHQEMGTVINLDDNYLLTINFIDLHAHFREPGFETKETLQTGAQAALYGGYQLVCLMANTNPVLDSEQELRKMILRAKYLPVKIKFFSAITKNLAGQQLVDYHKLNDLVVGFSDDGKYLQNKTYLKEILKFGQVQQKLVSLHVDNAKQLQPHQIIMHHSLASKFNHHGVDDDFETKNLLEDLAFVVEHQLPYHLCHISTATSIAAIRQAKVLNPLISCEVTPHHLALNHNMIEISDSNYKMNPPISSSASQQSLIQALNEGVIDVIATDHAPHEPASKQDLITSAVGVIGLQTTFPVLYTNLVLSNQVKLTTILQALTINCAKLINYPHGELKVNGQANFVIIDLKKQMKVTNEIFKSKSQNSPFLGQVLTGWPVINVIGGQIYYLNEEGKRWWNA